MSTFPIYHDLVSGTGFPEFSSSAEQLSISSTPINQPLYDHQKAADLAVLGILSEDDLLAILGLQYSVVPGALPLHVGGEESVSDVRNDNDFTAAIRSKAPHPRVVHACDHCRRRKTKCSGDQPVCTSCKKRGKVCQWTPLKTTKERRSRKPYDVGFEYRPRPRAPAPAPCIVAPRATYPSVLLPNPMTIWSIEDALAAAHASAIFDASAGRSAPDCHPTTTTQTPIGWSAPTQYDVDDDVQWIPSPPSSCPSLSSDISSRGSSPPDTPSRANSIPTSTGPLCCPGEDAEQNFNDIDVFFKDLYEGLSPQWSSVLQSWPDDTEHCAQ
ncbi:hypothetical protein CY34DRAFT_719859 [Suillus luteus UH-Slu-Lm8-n1]|uniref:Zn(2)-C6 fungal-type domain-containing protein n=1 Tax=Suillus luteus UH-Slu-Lm8-n1 TaxID=930992 RepID=A0A0D0A073_9AGAM|nr:hypothetical protein CY34DRAFT_719859 [Suillus luteus UH-Slu-Lm8-n1]